jgi:hypothetical protein
VADLALGKEVRHSPKKVPQPSKNAKKKVAALGKEGSIRQPNKNKKK